MSKNEIIAGSRQSAWKALARDIAKEAHEDNFSSHWGLGEVGSSQDEESVVGFYFYDSHPYAGDPERRAREHAELAVYLAARGCRLVASAAYGEDGYTTAEIYICDEGVDVADALRAADEEHGEILMRSVSRANTKAVAS